MNISETCPSTSTNQCSICTQEAHGIHFGVYSCRACAAFFRRCIVLKRSYNCKAGQRKCDVDKNDRHFCRACRLEKCFAVGMTEENVQLNRDRMSSVVSKRSKSPIKTKETVKPVLHAGGVPLPKERSPVELPLPPHTVLQLTKIFDEKRPLLSNTTTTEHSGLIRATEALKYLRVDQTDEVEILPAVNFENHLSIFEQTMCRLARWTLNCEEFARLETKTQLALFARSWVHLMRLEKVALTVDRLGEDVFVKRLIYAFDRFAIDENTKFVPYSNPNADGEKVRRLFISSFNSMIDVLCRPIFEMNLSIEEITFILLQLLWNVEDSDFEAEIIEIADRALEKLSSELHQYYRTTMKMPNYADRLIHIMLISKELERIQKERNKMFELARVFDYFGKERGKE